MRDFDILHSCQVCSSVNATLFRNSKPICTDCAEMLEEVDKGLLCVSAHGSIGSEHCDLGYSNPQELIEKVISMWRYLEGSTSNPINITVELPKGFYLQGKLTKGDI